MNLTNQEILGDILVNARLEKGYSQRQLATLAGISNVEVSTLEKGERLKPNPEILARLSKALDLEYEELLEVIGYIDNAPFGDNRFMLSPEDKDFIAKLFDQKSKVKPAEAEAIFKSALNSKVGSASARKEIPVRVYNPIKKICDQCNDAQIQKFIALCNWFIEHEVKK